MTKKEMIETLITATLEKRATMKLYEEAFGVDNHTTKREASEWVALFDIIQKLGLEYEYAKLIK